MYVSLLIRIIQHSWPLLTLPLILYGGTVLPFLFDPTTTWIIRAWLPGLMVVIAFILYRQQRPGALTAFSLSAVIALGVGGLIAWTVSRQCLVPYLPRHSGHILWSIRHIDWTTIGHSLGSGLVGLILALRVGADYIIKGHTAKTTHGSARLATKAELNKVLTSSGLPLGFFPQPYDPYQPLKTATSIDHRSTGSLLFVKPGHTMVIAPSGAGKGVGYVIPTLLEYAGSVFVTDIKAENYTVTAAYRRTLGRHVVAFDPFALTDVPTISINPLLFIDRHAATAVNQTAKLAQLLCPTNRQAPPEMRHFTHHGASLIQTLLLYVVYTKDYAPKHKHLGTVYDLLSLGDQGLKEQLDLLSRSKLCAGTVGRLAAAYVGTADREFSGIANTARAQLQFIDSPLIREALATTTFDLQDMVQGKADFYLCIPPEYLDTQAPLIRLLASLVFQQMIAARGQRHAQELLMIIDEMPALGYIPQFEDALVYGRGYGVTLMGFAQTLELLQSVYPKTWRTFLSSNTTIFIEATELQTADYVSQKMGKGTIQQQTHNEGKSQQQSWQRALSKQQGRSTSETSRPLLTADEVASLGPEVSLVFLRGERPLMLQRPTYYEHIRWQQKFAANPLELGAGTPNKKQI